MLDVCVDYVGRDGTADMDEIACRFATQASVPLVLDSTEPQVMRGRPRAHRRPGHPQLGQPRGRRAARQPPRPGLLARPRVRLRGHLPAHRRAGPGPRRRVEAGDRPPHPPHRQRALRPHRRATSSSTPSPSRSRPATTTCAATPCTPSRPSGASRPRSPAPSPRSACPTCRFGLSPGGPPRAQQRVPARVRAGRPRLGHRPRRAHHAAEQDPRRAARRLPRPHLRPAPPAPTARPPTTRCTQLLEVFADVKAANGREGGPQRLAGRGAAQAPHHRRRPRRPHRRPRRGPGRRACRRSTSSTTCCSTA